MLFGRTFFFPCILALRRPIFAYLKNRQELRSATHWRRSDVLVSTVFFFFPSLSSKVDLPLGVGLSINFGLVEPAPVLVVHGLPGPGLLAGRHTDVDVGWDDEAEGLAHCFQVCTRGPVTKL